MPADMLGAMEDWDDRHRSIQGEEHAEVAAIALSGEQVSPSDDPHCLDGSVSKNMQENEMYKQSNNKTARYNSLYKEITLQFLYERCQFPKPKKLNYFSPPAPTLNLHVVEMESNDVNPSTSDKLDAMLSNLENLRSHVQNLHIMQSRQPLQQLGQYASHQHPSPSQKQQDTKYSTLIADLRE